MIFLEAAEFCWKLLSSLVFSDTVLVAAETRNIHICSHLGIIAISEKITEKKRGNLFKFYSMNNSVTDTAC